MGIAAAITAIASIGATVYSVEENKKMARRQERVQREATDRAERQANKQRAELETRRETERVNRDARRVAQVRRIQQGIASDESRSLQIATPSAGSTTLGGSSSTRKTALGS